MGPATLISLLILVVVASVVLKDVARMQTAAKPAPRPEDSPLIPRNVNDPLAQSVASLAHQVGALIGAGAGSGVGAAAGRGAGSAVSSAEVEVARGLGSQRISNEEIAELARHSARAAVAGGTAVGTQAAAPGSSVGSALFSFPAGLVSGMVGAQRATEDLPGPRSAYELPFLGGVFKLADALNWPKL